MAENTTFTKNLFNTLSSTFSDFSLDENQFYNKLKDPSYANKVYDVMSANIEGFNEDRNAFLDNFSFKKKDQPDLSLLTGSPVSTGKPAATSQSQSLSVSEPIDPKKLSRERKQLLDSLSIIKKSPVTKDISTDSFGVQQISEPRTEEINAIQKKIDELDYKLSNSGFNPSDSDALAELPDWALEQGGWANPKQMMKYKSENPTWFNRQMSKLKGMDLFFTNTDFTGMDQQDQNLLYNISAKNAQDYVNILVGHNASTKDIFARFEMIKPIIDRLKPEKRQEAMNYAKDYLGMSFNRFTPTEDSATAASLKIDKDQAAALEEMKLTDPDKYKDVVGVLSVPFKSIDVTDPLQLAGSRLQTDFLKRKGAEKVRYELKVAGRDNALKYAASRLQDWKIKYDKATNDQEKMDAVGQIEQWKNRIDSISEDAKTDRQNFPLYYEDQDKKTAKELLDDTDFNIFTAPIKWVGKKMSDVSEAAGRIALSPINAIASELIGPEYKGGQLAQEMGKAQETAAEEYLPPSLQTKAAATMLVPTKELKVFIDDLKKSGKSYEEQSKELISKIAETPDSYEVKVNPNAGESKSLFSKAYAISNAKTLVDIAALAGMGRWAMSEKILGPIASSAIPFYLDTQENSYKSRLEAGESPSSASSNSIKDGMVVAAATLIAPSKKIVDIALGKSADNAIKKTILGMTEDEWKAVTSKYSNKIIAGTNALNAVTKEAAMMGLVYGAGTTAAQEALEMGPNKKDLAQIVDDSINASYDMLTNSAGLLGITGIMNFKSVSPQAKASIYSMANEPLKAKAYIDLLEKNGTITKEAAAEKTAVVDKLSEVLATVPVRNKNGEPLTEQQRAGYLYRAYQKAKAKEYILPEKTKAEVDAKVKEMDEQNANIMDGTLEGDLNETKPTEAPKVLEDAPNVLAAITPVMGEKKPQLFTYENDAEYGTAVEKAGGTTEDAKTKGFYLDSDGSIHINLQRATNETMMHEGFHPVLNILAENKPEIITDIFGQLEKVSGAKDIIEKAQRTYEGDVTKQKEAITDFIANVAKGNIKMDASTFEQVKQWFIDALNKMGFTLESKKLVGMKDAAELKNLAEMIQKSFTTGEALTKEGLTDVQKAFEATRKVETGIESAGTKEGPLFFSKTDYGTSGITKKPALDKEEFKAEVASGRISVVDPYSALQGKKFAMTFPDDFFTGTIEVGGEPVGYGNGGVFYTAKHGKRGDAWASVSEGSASNFIKQANESLKVNNGEGTVVIVKGDDLKHKTSLESKVTFVNSILKYAAKSGETDGVIKAIKSAYNIGNVKDPNKIIQYFNNYLASGRSESGQRMVDAGVSFDTFATALIKEARPVVTKMMQDMGYKGENFFDGTQLKKNVELATTKGVKNMYADVLREDFLKNVKPGSAYAAIKFNSPLKFEKDPTHPSYPYVIRTVDGSPVQLQVFDKTFNTYGKDVAITGRKTESNKSFGVATTVSPEFTIKSDMKGSPSEISLGESLSAYEALKPSGKPEFAKEDQVQKAGLRKQMTEDDKGNYVFYHYSGDRLKSINPEKFGKNLATGRGERPGVGISMYYTRPDVGEPGVPKEFGYVVRIPKDKVYPFNQDPLNLLPEAEKEFKKQYPDQAFDFNKQIGFVTKVAADRGYPMTVAEWRIGNKKYLRAQTTEAMKPELYKEKVFQEGYQVDKITPELEFKPNAKRKDIEFSREEEKKASDIIAENIQIGKPEKTGPVQRFLKTMGDENFSVNWMDRLSRDLLDSLTLFNKAAKRVQGIRGLDEVLPANDPRVLVRLLNGYDAAFNEAVSGGMFDAKYNRIKSKDGSVMNIDWLLEPLGKDITKAEYDKNVKDALSYMVAKRTVELSKRFSREDIISGIGDQNVTDLKMAEAALKEFDENPNLDNIKEAASRYQEMADAALRYMVDKGRMPEAIYDKDGELIGGYKFIKENNLEYVALQRMNETAAGEPVEFTIKGKRGTVGGVSEPVKKIKGSERKIQDPYVSLLDNINKMMKEANRNEVMLAFRNLIAGEKDPDTINKLESIGQQVKEKGDGVVTIFVDGKPEYWKFQEDIYNAIKNLDSGMYNLPGWLTALPALMRWSVTHFPTFAARNVVRDWQSRLILSNNNPWESIKRTITTKDKWSEAARAGALNSGLYTQNKEFYYELMADASNKIIKDGGFVITADKVKNLWHAYEKALFKSETTGRVSEYEAAYNEAKKKGMDDYNAMLYAGSKARQLIDFAVAGNTMRVINQVIPFTNAAVQGLRSAAKSVKDNPSGFATRVLLFSILPELSVYALNNLDENKKKNFEGLPDWQRDMFYNIPVGNNKFLAIPKPFELSLFGSAFSRGMSYKDGNKKAFDGYAGTAYKSLTPVEGAEVGGPAKSLIEVTANYDFFRGTEIIPRSEMELDMSLRNIEDASRIGKVIGDVMKADPRMVDHFIKGQFTYFGKLGIELSNIGREEARDKFKLAEKSGFVKENSAYVSKPVQELRDFVDKWGIRSHPYMKYFKMVQDNYFAEKDPKQKEAIGIQMMDFAEQLMKIYKDMNIEQMQQLKKQMKQ